jgi:hypothetical protein
VTHSSVIKNIFLLSFAALLFISFLPQTTTNTHTDVIINFRKRKLLASKNGFIEMLLMMRETSSLFLFLTQKISHHFLGGPFVFVDLGAK